MATLHEVLKEMGFDGIDDYLNFTDKLIAAKGEETFQEWKLNDGSKEGLLELLK
jgi:hypothetical protein